MTTKRKLNFVASVAEEARAVSLPKPRGRHVSKNLTEEGRLKGLKAMRAVARCRSKRRDGEQCKKAVMRGATRCATHGGRAEVPNHPANIRRFLSGQMHRSIQKQEAFMEGKRAWDSMSRAVQRELVDALPREAVGDARTLYAAATLWKFADTLPRSEWRRRWRGLISPA